MQKNHTGKILAVGIIVLFIGVGIHPAFAVDTKQSIVRASEEDCGCNEIDDRQLVVLERQIDRLEMYSKLLLVLSKHHSEVLEDYEVITDMISTLKTLDLKDVICDKLLDLIFYILNKSDYYEKLWRYYLEENMLIRRIIAFYLFVLCGDLYLYLSQLYYLC